MSPESLPERLTPPRRLTPGVVQQAIPIPESAQPRQFVFKPVLDLLGLVRRQWWLVLLITAIALASSVYRLRNEKPIYRTAAVIRLEDKSRALSGQLGDNPSSQLGGTGSDPLLSQIQILQSNAVMREAATTGGLRLRYPLAGITQSVIRNVAVSESAPSGSLRLTFDQLGVTARAGSVMSQATYGQPLFIGGVTFTVTEYPGVPAFTATVVAVDAAAEGARNVRGTRRERTNIIDIAYQADDPLMAQRVVNAVVLGFESFNARTAKQQTIRRREFIEQQLALIESQLAEAQDAYNGFRSQQQTFSAVEKFKTKQADLSGLEVRRQELDADRRLLLSLLATMQTRGQDRMDALVASPVIASNPVVAQLYAQLTELQRTRDGLTTGQYAASASNPDVRRLDTLLASTRSRVLEAVRGQVSAVEARIGALDQLKASAASELSTLPTTEAAESKLVAAVDGYRRRADRLREELQKAQIEQAAEGGQVEIVDLATFPTEPIGSGKVPKVLLAAVFGLLLGTGAAYVRENRNDVIRRQEDLERVLGVSNLSLIPFIGAANASAAKPGKRRWLTPWKKPPPARAVAVRTVGEELVTVHNNRSTGAEAYRTLRTNILFSAAINEVRQLVITSAGPQEGKSTTASNLAVAFAQQGHRVLLIDCDLRRPRVHQIFQCTQQPGLTNLVVGGVLAANAIRASGVERLFLLPSGPCPPNPSELLGSLRMHQLFEQLSENYDIVIYDTPPVLAASDSAILGRRADGVVLVVRAGATEWGAVRETMHQLDAVGARVLGTVLNDPDAEATRYGGHYYNNYYEYTSSSSSVSTTS